MSMVDGSIKHVREEERVEPCGIPIFRENATICKSCYDGWTAEGNILVDNEYNNKLISSARERKEYPSKTTIKK